MAKVLTRESFSLSFEINTFKEPNRINIVKGGKQGENNKQKPVTKKKNTTILCTKNQK